MSGDRTPVTLVLADDHVFVRTGIRLLLERAGMEVLAEADDAEGAVRMVLGHKPDVLLLDLVMPGSLSSLDAIPQALSASPDTRVVVLTSEEGPGFALRALQAGASGYVLKHGDPAEVVAAIRQVAAGGVYLHPRVGAALATASARRAAHDDGMSPRELDVLRLVALGHTNAEMARELHLSTRTIETHRSRIQHKLGRFSRAQLVRYALDRGLLTDDDER